MYSLIIFVGNMDVKSIIKERGFRMEEVAKIIGVTPVSFSQTISGNPTVRTLQRIADAIGCQVGDFFRDEMENHDFDFLCPYCKKPIKVDMLNNVTREKTHNSK